MLEHAGGIITRCKDLLKAPRNKLRKLVKKAEDRRKEVYSEILPGILEDGIPVVMYPEATIDKSTMKAPLVSIARGLEKTQEHTNGTINYVTLMIE